LTNPYDLMRYNKPKRNRFRSKDKDFRRNGSQDLNLRGGSVNSVSKGFQRRSFGKNGFNAERLLEKYSNLAKEALTSGDKILSENYYQHADHFLRVIENRNLIQNKSRPHLNNSSIEENSDDKIISEDKKNSSYQQPQNSEEI